MNKRILLGALFASFAAHASFNPLNILIGKLRTEDKAFLVDFREKDIEMSPLLAGMTAQGANHVIDAGLSEMPDGRNKKILTLFLSAVSRSSIELIFTVKGSQIKGDNWKSITQSYAQDVGVNLVIDATNLGLSTATKIVVTKAAPYLPEVLKNGLSQSYDAAKTIVTCGGNEVVEAGVNAIAAELQRAGVENALNLAYTFAANLKK